MKKIFFIFIASFYSLFTYSQNQQFEEAKNNGTFDSLKILIGGDFALQYQSIKCKADSALVPLGNGINLPTANLNINGYLAKGIKVNLVTYLSARHHNESWVKGGYLLIDDMPFLHSTIADNLMKYLTIKVGVMELNYGDQHFRRSDNGHVISNPFVGNYIMDPFTTASAMEIMFRNTGGIIAMLGTTGGVVNTQLTSWNSTNKKFYTYNIGDELGYYGKLWYDKLLNKDLRVRGTFSFYLQDATHSGTLYAGDRTGSRYYLVMNRVTGRTGAATDVDIKTNAFSGNWGPGAFHNNISGMINLFVKYKWIELFGYYEQAKGITAYTPNLTKGQGYKFNQIGVEGIFRFGKNEQYYIGGKYNTVGGHYDPISPSTVSIPDQSISRISGALGWYMNKYTLTKIEYVTQTYNKFSTQYGDNASFSGLMVEAAISF